MEKENRTVCFDKLLSIEAYHFIGLRQAFPNHFHQHYVIGIIEKGERHLTCKNKEYLIKKNDLLLFNPRDNHSCKQLNSQAINYRCLNIKPQVLKKITYEITGKDYLPYFTQQVIFNSELAITVKELHLMIEKETNNLNKEQYFYFLLEQLINEHSSCLQLKKLPTTTEEIKIICKYLEENYKENISLNDLSLLSNLSKYHLLRTFTKQKGITPFKYLETLRINKAKTMLEAKVPVIEVALQTGFADQSHFTHFFKKFIGLTPKQYMNIFKNS